MNLRIIVSSVAVTLMALGSASVQADDIVADLEYDSSDSTWELYLTIADGTPDTVDGSNGIAGFVATFNGLDFGTDGDAVTFAPGTGAITDGSGNPTVIDLGSGDIEFLYGQDISESLFSVVTGVGSTKTLLASGTYSTTPTHVAAEGMDGTFLDAAVSPFGVVDPDNVIVNVTAVAPPQLIGDYDGNGSVAQGDLDVVLLNWGTNTFEIAGGGGPAVESNLPYPSPNGGGPFDGTINQNELDGVLLNWGNSLSAAAAAVPEPTSLALFGVAFAAGLIRRRK